MSSVTFCDKCKRPVGDDHHILEFAFDKQRFDLCGKCFFELLIFLNYKQRPLKPVDQIKKIRE